MSSRSLVPREYGAYAELGFPIVTGIAMAGLSLPGVGFALVALAGFLASEPLAVVAGARGQRSRTREMGRARRRLAVLGGLAAMAAAVAAVTAPAAARVAALVPAGLAAALIPILARGRQKSLGGELLVAAALSAMVLPVGVAGGLDWTTAALVWGVWLATFWLATLTVHAIKTRFKPALGAAWTLWGAPGFAVTVIGLALAGYAAGHLGLPVVLAVTPAVLVAGTALGGRVTPRQLRRVGWSLVAANVTTFGLLLLV